MIQVGGATEIEVKERKDRVDDALNATRAAVEEGIVAGGGVRCSMPPRRSKGLKCANDDQRVGIDIVRRAPVAPAQIVDNAGVDGSVVVGKVMDRRATSTATTPRPASSSTCSRPASSTRPRWSGPRSQDAASVAGLLITTEAMIAEKPKKKGPGRRPGMGGMGGMGGMM